MLLNDFFHIRELEITGTSLRAGIAIYAGHSIFDGHFPGQPVVPGVCMMQMVMELMESVLEMKLRLRKADHLKFLAVINPLADPVIQTEFTYEINSAHEYIVTGRFYKEALTFLKFKLILVPEQ